MQKELEYPANYLADALISPIFSSLVEVSLWFGFFKYTGQTQLLGLPTEAYLSYALWAGFMSRISANWMYEFVMMNEIETGRVNTLLTRPISFYEYYLGQYLGYKLLTCWLSFLIPIGVYFFAPGTVHLERLPMVFLMVLFYIIFSHTMSFCIACVAFYITRAHSLTFIKNMVLMLLTGELFPLDLFPAQVKNILLALPFSCGVFIPVGYLTGRIDIHQVGKSFLSLMLSQIVLSLIAYKLWQKGRIQYSGTGA